MSRLRLLVLPLFIALAAPVPASAQEATPPTAARKTAQAQKPADAPKPASAAPININTATVTDLQKLPGIGPATAARIVEYRQKNGPFTKIEQLMNVRGIGEKSFLKLKPLIVATPPRTEAIDR